MTTAVAVAIFWVVLGLVVFAVAVRSGRGGEGGSGEAAKRHGMTGLIVLAFVFGLVAPTLVLAHNAEHKASEGPGGLRLTAAETTGRELFSEKCNLCHTLQAANAVARTGPNLDVLVPTVPQSARKAYVLSAIMEGEARGFGQMPALLYQGKEAEDVAAFVAAVAGH
ncbi:MAG TPA: cytochrome c [Solirubrobacteraceae bacterium]|nr:cytochrome c [Solirubrobacteraceae bacterium]